MEEALPSTYFTRIPYEPANYELFWEYVLFIYHLVLWLEEVRHWRRQPQSSMPNAQLAF